MPSRSAVRGCRRQFALVIKSVAALVRSSLAALPARLSLGRERPVPGCRGDAGGGMSRDITVRSPGGNLGVRRVRQRRCPRPARHADRTGRRLAPQDAGADIPHDAGAPENLNWTLGPGQVVAAAAVVAVGLPAGEASLREMTGRGYDVAALAIPGSDPELADAALAALLIAAGRDGAWHQGWVDAGTALQARRTTDQLASVFYRCQHRNDQELLLGP